MKQAAASAEKALTEVQNAPDWVRRFDFEHSNGYLDACTEFQAF